MRLTCYAVFMARMAVTNCQQAPISSLAACGEISFTAKTVLRRYAHSSGPRSRRYVWHYATALCMSTTVFPSAAGRRCSFPRRNGRPSAIIIMAISNYRRTRRSFWARWSITSTRRSNAFAMPTCAVRSGSKTAASVTRCSRPRTRRRIWTPCVGRFSKIGPSDSSRKSSSTSIARYGFPGCY